MKFYILFFKHLKLKINSKKIDPFNVQKQPPEVFYNKKLFLKISQYSQENTRVSCNFIIKRLQHRCFPVNIAKFLGTSIMKTICEQLFLKVQVAISKAMRYIQIKEVCDRKYSIKEKGSQSQQFRISFAV